MSRPSCQSCRNSELRIVQAKGDLVAAARKAARWPTERNIHAVNRAKDGLARCRQVGAQHELICDVLTSA